MITKERERGCRWNNGIKIKGVGKCDWRAVVAGEMRETNSTSIESGSVGAADIPLCFSNMADIVCTPTLPLFFIASSISFLRRIELHARPSNFRSAKSCTTNVITLGQVSNRVKITDKLRLIPKLISFYFWSFTDSPLIEFPWNYITSRMVSPNTYRIFFSLVYSKDKSNLTR